MATTRSFKAACPSCHKELTIEVDITPRSERGLYTVCDHCGVNKRVSAFQREYRRQAEAPAQERLKAQRAHEQKEQQAARERRTQEKQETKAQASAIRTLIQKVLGMPLVRMQAVPQMESSTPQPVVPAHNVMGAGCPRCGSTHLRQDLHITGAGWIIFFAGLALAICTLGLSLIMCFAVVPLRERQAKCLNCKWKWTT